MGKKTTYACVVILFIAIIGLIYFIFNRDESTPTIIPQEKLLDANTIEGEIAVKPQDAKEIVTQIKEIKVYQKEPVATYVETTNDIDEATLTTAKRIDTKDETLPKEAIEDTDRTIVSNDGTKVDVYKINTYRNWEAGVGVGRLDDTTYFPVSLQRNYDRCHSVEVQANLGTDGSLKGGQIMWKVHF